MVSSHWVKAWSKYRSFIAFSPAESEFDASVRASAQALGARSISKDLDIHFDMEIFADASAAPGIISRRGILKIRHVDANYLWTQEMAARKMLKYNKLMRTQDPADLLIK